MKSFNLTDALAGKPVVTRSGQPVTQLKHFTGVTDKFCLKGVVDGVLASWIPDNGHYLASLVEHEFDLFMLGKKVWINLYPQTHYSSAADVIGYKFGSRELADAISDSKRIACIEVELDD